jgi:hypothetical protein
VVVSLEVLVPRPPAQGGISFAIAWPGLVLYAVITGSALSILLRPAR